MTNRTVGLLHPGEMGVTVGAAVLAGGSQVLWASDGRSPATYQRARTAGFSDLRSLTQLIADSDVIISVCPPHEALGQAREVAKIGFSGIYVDANAVSTTTAQNVREIIEMVDASYVDGGIIGPPAQQPETTRLYLSGAKAPEIAELFRGTLLSAITIGEHPASASALKMCYAAYTKGHSALLIAIRALAQANGVEQALLREWSFSQPELAQRSEQAASRNARKAWRFAGEMREIAATFEAAGLPDGFHRGAAELYTALASFKDSSNAPAFEAVIAALLVSTRASQ